MDFDELSPERIVVFLWCMVVLFTDRLDFGQYNVPVKLMAVMTLILLSLFGSFFRSPRPAGTTYKLSKKDYMILMESKGFHFTNEQKEAAEKEESGEK